MTREEYYDNKEELKININRLEMEQEELEQEYNDLIQYFPDGDCVRCREIELKLSYNDSDLEELNDELDRLMDNYDAYMEDRRCAYEEEMREI